MSRPTRLPRSRSVIIATVVVAGCVGSLGLPHLVGSSPAGAEESAAPLQSNGLENEGAGMYTDPSVAFQLSGFTINRRMVSCAVGTLAVSVIPGQPGPFSMLMYSTKIDSYDVHDHQIIATGRMRSITRMGNQTNEDVEHPFKAVATDNRGSGPDTFVVHFSTPFWDPAHNPMSSKSSLVPGWAQFGGAIATDAAGHDTGDIAAGG
jgi:hypothetical protein